MNRWFCPGQASVRFPTPVFDIEVCDDEGRVAVSLRGLSTRVLISEEERGTALLIPSWKEVTIPMHQPEATAEPLASVASPVVVLCELPNIKASHIQSQMASGGLCRRLRVNVIFSALGKRCRESVEAGCHTLRAL